MNANFTQIYYKTRSAALALLAHDAIDFKPKTEMHKIENAQETLADIYQKTSNSPIM